MVEGVFAGCEAAFELLGLDFIEDLFEAGTGGEAAGDEIAAGDKGRGDEGFGGEFGGFGVEEVVIFGEAVGGGAIDAVEFHFKIEGGRGHEAFEVGFPHLRDVHELHVTGDHVDGIADYGVRVFEAGEDGFGHFRTDGFVAVEADAAIRVGRFGGGLGDIVEEGGEAKGEGGVRGEHFQHDAGMGEYIALGVPSGWLFAANHGQDFGEEVVDEGGGDEEFEAVAAMGMGEDFRKFIADALGRDFPDEGGVFSDRGEGDGLDLEGEGGGKADGAEEAEGIFLEAVGGCSDGAEGFCFEIGKAVHVIDDFTCFGIFEEAVDGEIAAVSVFSGSGEGDGGGAAAVFVRAIGAEGCDLDVMFVMFYDDDAEVGTDFVGMGEEGEDFSGGGGGCDIVVFRGDSEELVADAAAGEKGGVAGCGKEAGEVGGGGAGGHGEVESAG